MLQILKFALIGMGSSAVNFCVFNAVLLCLRPWQLPPGADMICAQVLGFLVSVLWCFLLNRRFVFTTEQARAVPWHRALLKTYASYSFTGIVLGMLLSFLWVSVLRLPKPLVPVLNDCVGFPVNFLLNKFWAFSSGASRRSKAP